ncbi:sugar kinase [Gilliamella apicola]|uniref:Sugar kinase n=1 Tax=Gilliamella apicola TaxID=1196095 RepID=A0A556RKE6_9GAMM|nr:sugar kinase [Gilliamella apicola]TSJ89336.1 sugar kinase [Gilliamella apicola]
MKVKICTLGELFVEFVAKEFNQRFDQTSEYIGPYPSGAPAIFANQVAKLGFPVIFLSCVGKDPFGKMCINRLKQDGVNVKGITSHNKVKTATAFSTQIAPKERSLIYNILNSACGLISFDHVDEALLKDCNHLHIMGSSLYSFRAIDAISKAMNFIKSNGGTISFDPNLHKEMSEIREIEQSFSYILEYTDIMLINEKQVKYFAENHGSEKEIISSIMEKGIKYIVVKKGGDGANCYVYDNRNNINMIYSKGFDMDIIDYSGADYCFDATFVSLLLTGFTIEQALEYANASYALSSSCKGPMEGTSSLIEIQKFLS